MQTVAQRKRIRRWWQARARRFAISVCAALIVGSLCASLPAQAEISSSEEYRLKLAFLFNFAKFVEWPADAFPTPQAPLEICIIGRDPFDAEFERQVMTRTLYGHPVAIRTLRPSDDFSGCHIIFLPASSDGSLPGVLKRLDGSAITVGESAGFVARGGVVNFVIEGTMLRFEVNLSASRRIRSRISSRFLALARIYKE
jgi:YfiR/HmsC-like